jgi:molybdopterin molybdotransferase
MRTPQEAVSIILEHSALAAEAVIPPAEAVVPLAEAVVPLADAVGRVLARDVFSDLDLPPFRKSAMDGFAVRSSDFDPQVGEGPRRLRQVGEARAGDPFRGELRAGECAAIYTGAEVPPSADAVVVVERSRREGQDVFLSDQPRPGQHICAKGEDLGWGDLVLPRGRRLRPADLSALAAVGCEPVPVFRRPRVAVLTTGDELVPPDQQPGPGQIREGNTLHLAAMARAAGAEVLRTAVLPDHRELLREAFARVLDEVDVLVTTGGVSMGEYDLVGEALAAAGVEEIFHKVAIKPGKPVWFGRRGRVLVFGLPGNPVSCLVGHEVFVRPALARLGGAEAEVLPPLPLGRWAGEPAPPNPRQQNLPVRVEAGADGVPRLVPVPWRSSGDVVALTRAQGLAVVEPDSALAPGAQVPYRPLV